LNNSKTRSCPACNYPLNEIDFKLGEKILDSVGTTRDWNLSVLSCEKCGSIFKTVHENVESFYENEYEIPFYDFEDDQVYKINTDNSVTYRTDFQSKLVKDFVKNSSSKIIDVLDFGCARAQTAAKLSTINELNLYGYDISKVHYDTWKHSAPRVSFFGPDQLSIYYQKFDLVYSFFALEHAFELSAPLEQIKLLLKDKGSLIVALPNSITNPADLLLCDHVNHFSSKGLMDLFHNKGFNIIKYSDSIYTGAHYIELNLDKSKESKYYKYNFESNNQLNSSYSLWKKDENALKSRLDNLEKNKFILIHGAGIYAKWILSILKNSNFNGKIKICDANPSLHGKELDSNIILSTKKIHDEYISYIDLICIATSPKVANEIQKEYKNKGYKNLFFGISDRSKILS